MRNNDIVVIIIKQLKTNKYSHTINFETLVQQRILKAW
jgi:hypothetical protein